ncbi:hypothetical protein MBLNU457_4521t1 [Dothideomycetes sp. NU457]
MNLHLSAEACALLDKFMKLDLNVMRFILYHTDAVPKDVITKLCSEASFEYVVAEAEIKAEVFVPVLPCQGQRDVQAALDKHMQNLAKLSAERDEGKRREWEIWPFGLVVADEPGRPLVILLDENRARWRISHCRIPFKELDRLGTPLYYNEVEVTIEEFNGVLGTGGPPPDWKYSFAIFSTGMDYPNGVIDRQIDNGSSSYPEEEWAVYLFTKFGNRNQRMSWEDAVEMFPRTCAPAVNDDGEPRPSPVQSHPHLFLCIDTPTPVNGILEEILICNMIWDGNTDRSREELEAIGRTSEVVKTRCQTDKALETIRRMADELDKASKVDGLMATMRVS